MTNVLADLALESEAATVLTMWLARAYDENNDTAQVIRRIVTPAAKFWICKRTPFLTYEAMEVLGGSGYIEESIMPRLYREAPVNSIWEGSGNVMCLDVLRALERTPNAVEVLRRELDEAKDARIKAFAERIEKRLAARDHADKSQARALVRDLVLALQGSLLVRHAPSNVSDAFCASRLDGEGAPVFGLLPRGAGYARHRRTCRSGELKFSEHREYERDLRKKADGEGERAENRHAHRVEDDVRQPRPEIDRAGNDGVLGRVALCVKNEHQRRENDEVLDGIGVREIEPLRPGGLRLIVAARDWPSSPSGRAPWRDR